LWIDEIEKGLSGTGSSNFSDGGTSSRVFGTFISWLQDKTKPVFVIATANDVSQLPAELLRKGRFDAIWFVDLPTEEERKEIYKIHLQRIKPVGRDFKKFDLDKLAKIRYERNGEYFDYSGAEIEEAINDALFAKYSEAKSKGIEEEKIVAGSKYDITTDDIVEALQNTIPISCTAQEKISKIRKWGQKHARFASAKAKEIVDGSITKKPKKGEKSTAKFTADDLDITSGL
jgi:SpoVK/Ycf46/Vps4 family AAA+-type ATPase